jgi:integrase
MPRHIGGKRIKKILRLFDEKQVQSFLAAITLPHHKMITKLIFATGLRLCEAIGSERQICAYCREYGDHYCERQKKKINPRQKPCDKYNDVFPGLRVEDIDFSRRLIKVTGKGRKEREVAADSTILTFQELAEYLKEQGISTGRIFNLTQQAVRKQWREAARKAGLPQLDQQGRWSPHAGRHTALTFLQERGRDIVATMQQAGHERIDTTVRTYLHPRPESRVRLMDEIAKKAEK